jgi:predicted Rossmann fold flavoprotein
VRNITSVNEQWELQYNQETSRYDAVIVATGGSPKRTGLQWLEQLGIRVVDPVPSLFTFNLVDQSITELAGVAVQTAKVRVEGSKLEFIGPVLITHWGLSGPAVLRCSAWGARHLAERHYDFSVHLNWLGVMDEERFRDSEEWKSLTASSKKVGNEYPATIPKRLWWYLLTRAEQDSDKRWIDLSKKEKNKILQLLTADVYDVRGKTTFKEEFVTAGGVELDEIDPNSMQCKKLPGLYFTGEVLDIDGETGGFNFQAAWSTAWLAGQLKGA